MMSRPLLIKESRSCQTVSQNSTAPFYSLAPCRSHGAVTPSLTSNAGPWRSKCVCACVSVHVSACVQAEVVHTCLYTLGDTLDAT